MACCCQHTFVLYTKPDCPLCDGLKVCLAGCCCLVVSSRSATGCQPHLGLVQDKLQALIDRAAFMPSFLTGASLQVCVCASCRSAAGHWLCTNKQAWLANGLHLCAAQVRDISTNQDWQDAMHLSVPVLALLDSQGQEVSRTAVTGAVRLTRLLAADKEQSSRAVRIWLLTLLAVAAACVQVVLPRPQPRVPADRLQQHLQQALQDAGVSMDSSGGGGSNSGGSDQPFTVVS